jgi:hypothetical protein
MSEPFFQRDGVYNIVDRSTCPHRSSEYTPPVQFVSTENRSSTTISHSKIGQSRETRRDKENYKRNGEKVKERWNRTVKPCFRKFASKERKKKKGTNRHCVEINNARGASSLTRQLPSQVSRHEWKSPAWACYHVRLPP